MHSRQGEQHGPRKKPEEFKELKTISVARVGENKGRGVGDEVHSVRLEQTTRSLAGHG